jgi:hypothetical protein
MIKTLLVSMVLAATSPARADYNSYVLQAIRGLPSGGGYAINDEAGQRFIAAIRAHGEFSVEASQAKPSFCTSATYLVLATVVEQLKREGKLASVPASALELLSPPPTVQALYKDDGVGMWGRWNANGPGTAKFFYDARLGTNFESLKQARAGDFLKLWWTDEVGGQERGHSVVYLGSRRNADSGATEIQYWSSNQGAGYTRKWIPLSQAKHLIFSRLEHPENLRNLGSLPTTDGYLQSCQSQPSSFAEAKAKSGVN